MTLVISNSELADLVDLPQAIACIEWAFEEQGRGQVTPWAPYELKSGGAVVRVRSGGLADQGRLGFRITSSGARLALLFDSPGAQLLAVMGYPFSDLRLHATAAVGIDRLSPPGARRLAILGSGSNALGLLRGACAVRRVESVRVFSPNADHRSAFAREATAALGLPVTPAEDPEPSVADAEIVIVATNSRAAALQGAWLAPNAHVTSIGARSELDEDVYLRAALVTTTSRVHELDAPGPRDQWQLARLVDQGRVRRDEIVEMGDVMSGRVARPERGVTVFRDPQGGFTDIALAAWAYERARERGLGQELSLD